MRQWTPIGPLLLEEVEGWRFSLRDGTIAGKRGTQPGVLRIINRNPNEITPPVNHESCLKAAAEFANVPLEMMRRQQTLSALGGPFGWGSARWGKDYVCAWYCCRPLGLIIGVYAFPVVLFHESEQQDALHECARMISSAVFNRPAWGADEPLTRFLMEQLDAQQRLHLNFSNELPRREEGYLA
jgi:hypothetical protein